MKGIHLTIDNGIKRRIQLQIALKLKYSQTELCKRAARRKRKQAPRASNQKYTICSPSFSKSCENKTKIKLNPKIEDYFHKHNFGTLLSVSVSLDKLRFKYLGRFIDLYQIISMPSVGQPDDG